VLTFEPHPRKVLFPEQKDLKLLTLAEEKLTCSKITEWMWRLFYPFDKNFSTFEASELYRKVLIKSLQVKYLVIGYDHHFGKDRGGNIKVIAAAKR